jgi:hypothetical protein
LGSPTVNPYPPFWIGMSWSQVVSNSKVAKMIKFFISRFIIYLDSSHLIIALSKTRKRSVNINPNKNKDLVMFNDSYNHDFMH